ncbi:hypothetical protein BJG93_35205 [Paraburkholderia sprentiae WSM5005]|uniref:Uncharacterized protein n=1 Tax=Paraburkholderia sprentiae WSM5005 TaxID=754502 RepID=A0A8F4KHJ7_9BURK|nr:hypothetical protein [Paraburkholderia sprentiae]QXE07193.1 hypothetical protein BJG93_35205 [Paraburkholderia sprentiae WSM5005]
MQPKSLNDSSERIRDVRRDGMDMVFTKVADNATERVNLSRRTCRHSLASALTRNNNRPATSTFERSNHLAAAR